MSAALRRATVSLAIPNYRRYFAGQVVSISGNWMQTVAEMWLVVKLTGSGVSVGITAGLQFLPMLLLGAMGGVLADRYDKRRLLMLTQALMALPALAPVGAHRQRGRSSSGWSTRSCSCAARCSRSTTRRARASCSSWSAPTASSTPCRSTA